MPELPEVETVVRGLNRIFPGKIVTRAACFWPKIDRDNGSGWKRELRGLQFITARRRGKNILIEMSRGYTLWIHLKMTGHIYYRSTDEPLDKHDLVVFDLKDETGQFRYHDYRRFGRVRLRRTADIMQEPGLAELGPEPLEIGADEFAALCRRTNRMIKPALLDQTFLAGLGNIYCDESLFMTRIHPRKTTGKISLRKLIELHGNIQKLLKKAIRLTGTTSDSFAGVNGEIGRFQKYLAAYGREGQPCGRCGTAIVRKKIGTRSAHFCPRCQRVRRGKL
jgi:formamidopyrimidine-DNA glycosylase